MDNEIAVQPEFDISDFITDPTLENNGVWFPLGRNREIKLARVNNPDYKRLVRAKYKSARAVLEQEDDAAQDLNDQMMIEVYAQTIIKGLRVDGKDVAYTPSLGVKLMKQSNDLRDKIFGLAKDAEAYKVKAEDEAVKS